MPITIQNRLEIQPGGVLLVPGCESPSIHSSDSLAANLQCKASHISLETALSVVPGSKVIFWQNSGGGRGVRMRFFVLPDGPPGPGTCPSICATDWYAVLRANADGAASCDESSTPTVSDMCDMFAFSKARSELL